MEQSVGSALARITHYRDRFSNAALVVGFVSAVMALWTTAPALDVSLPLVGGTKVGLNIGYVLMAGIPMLTIALMWLTGPLLSMQRLQHAVVDDLERHRMDLTAAQRHELLGPFVQGRTEKFWTDQIYGLASAIRYFMFFVCPLLSQVWVGDEYFRHLYAYRREAVVDQILSEVERDPDHMAPLEWRISPKFKVSVVEYFGGTSPRAQMGYTPKHFTINNSDLERRCAQVWVAERLETLEARGSAMSAWQQGLGRVLETKTRGVQCVVDGFPRFELAVNSWINVLSFGLSIWCVSTAWRLYRGKAIADRVAGLRTGLAEPAASLPSDSTRPPGKAGSG